MAAILAPLTCLFGEIKEGKTSAALQAYPGALCIGVPDNMRLIWCNTMSLPADAIWIQEPAPRDIEQLLALITDIESWPDADRPPAIIVDDFGKMVEQTYRRFDESREAYMTTSGKHDNFYAGKQVSPLIDVITEKCRHLGIAVVFILHEKQPKFDNDGNWRRGMPALPWQAMTRQLQGWFDVNVRVVGDEDSLDPWLSRALYHKHHDRNWITGDRSEVCWEHTPGSLYEVLRAGGAKVSRFPGLEWQDGVADEVAAALADAGVTDCLSVKKALALCGSTWQVAGRKKRHIRWAVQDGIARFAIRQRLDADLFDFEDINVHPVEDGSPGSVSPPPR